MKFEADKGGALDKELERVVKIDSDITYRYRLPWRVAARVLEAI